MSVPFPKIATMFEDSSDAEVVAAIGDFARAENAACARRLAAIAELYDRRQIPVEDGDGRELWRMDPWEAVAAEVAAAECITSAAAGALMLNAVSLRDRLPKVAALFAPGAISYRTVRLILARTLLALEPDALAGIDAELAAMIPTWGPLSVNKMQQAVDAVVVRHDSEARRRTESRSRGRHVEIVHDRDIAYLSGELHQTDATLLERRLTAFADSVCENDPRTPDQRRADALGAMAAGHAALACACGSESCPVRGDVGEPPSVIVHVVATATAIGAADAEAVNGRRPEDNTVERIVGRERLAEILAAAVKHRPADAGPAPEFGTAFGGFTVPAGVLADLAARGVAELRPVVHPGDSPAEPRYRPSAALAQFIRCRDLTCRFPGCDCPADFCDIDHTIPWGRGGPTHASNCKLLCRKHHLLKTFWTRWRDEQLPDGTVIWTSPFGHTYRTVPGSRLLIPALCVPTGTITEGRAVREVTPHRGAMMPLRKRTRAADRHHRILAERRLNTRL